MKRTKVKKIVTLIATFVIILICTSVNVLAVNEALSTADSENELLPNPNATIVKLNTANVTVYLSKVYQINPTIINGIGTTLYKSNKNKVATVNKDGKIRALKTGTSVITVTNNNASAKLFVNVKKPHLKKKNIKVEIGNKEKVQIVGKKKGCKVTYTSSNSKVAKITKYGNVKGINKGTSTITIKTNRDNKYNIKATTLKLGVKITKPILRIKYKMKKKVFNLKVGTPKKVVNMYSYTSNIGDIKERLTKTNHPKMYKKLKNKLKNKTNNPTVVVENAKVAKFDKNKLTLVPKDKGTSNITIKCGKKKFVGSISVTKPAETTFKGKKAKIAYSASQAYEYYKKALTEFYIKGEKPDYRYVKLAYANNKSWNTVEEELEKEITKNFDQNDNFYSIEHHLSYGFNRHTDNEIKYIYLDEVYTDTEIKDLKKLYDESQKIFESININAFDEDYEKLIALHFWLKKNVYYDTERKNPYYGKTFGSEKAIIYKHLGVCSDYAWATDYFCALLKIPSISTGYYSDSNHEWNIVKVQDSWYHLDNLNGVLFYGNKDIRKLALRNEGFKLTKYYTSEKWEERVAYDVLPQITKDKLKEIAYACGITTDKYNIYVWNYQLDESGWIIEEPQSS